MRERRERGRKEGNAERETQEGEGRDAGKREGETQEREN